VNKRKICDESVLRETISFLEKKTINSNMRVKNTSFSMNFLKVMYHGIKRIGYSKHCNTSILRITLPYSKFDVRNIPENINHINNLKISILDCVWVLKLYLYYSFKNPFKIKSEYHYHLTSIVSVAYLGILAIKKINPIEVDFYDYSVVPEVAALIQILSYDPSIEVHYHEYVDFVDTEMDIKTNVYYSANEICHNYVLNHKDRFQAEVYKFRQDSSCILRMNEKLGKKRTIGLYMSGFYARKKQGGWQPNFYEEGISAEQLLIERFSEYAKSRPEVNILICPHYKRNIETYEDAKRYYKNILKLKNCQLCKPNSIKNSPIENVDLGVVLNSSVFWQRIVIGLKTIFVNSVIINDCIYSSNLSNICLETIDNDFEASVDKFLYMNVDEFYAKIYPLKLKKG
jgi:hypothetical protein